MDDEIELPEQLDRGFINISYFVHTRRPLTEVVSRVNRHFEHSDLGYRYESGDTFRLKVRPTAYPVFGSFVGKVHIIERQSRERSVMLEGLLEYRMSALWFFAVVGFFFLLIYVLKPGLWTGAFFEAFGTGLTLFFSYRAARNERDKVAEHIEASFISIVNSLN